MAAAMVRAQALRGYRHLVTDLGGDPGRLLRRAGIRVSALDQLTALVSFEAMIDLLESSAAELGCPDFGLRLAERQDLGILGTLAVAMRYSPTVGEALVCAAKHLDAYNPAVGFTINTGDQPGQVRLDLQALHDHARPWAQTAEHGIGLLWRIVCMLSEGQCALRGAWFPHSAVASDVAYQSRFDAPMGFNADRAALAIDADDLDLPISGHNNELHAAATATSTPTPDPSTTAAETTSARSSRSCSAPERVAANGSPRPCTCTRARCNGDCARRARRSKTLRTRPAATSRGATCPTRTCP